MKLNELTQEQKDLFVKSIDKTKDNLDYIDTDDIIWNRDIQYGYNHIKNSKDYFNIFGHTITDEVILNEKYASIETGVARERGGKLSCIAYPSMKIYQSGDLK